MSHPEDCTKHPSSLQEVVVENEAPSLLGTSLPAPSFTWTNLGLRQEHFGYIIILCSSLFMAGMAIFLRVAQFQFGLSTLQCMFIRGVMQTLLAIIFLSLTTDIQTQINLQPRIKYLLLAGSALALPCIFLYFKSMRLIQAGDATSIFFTSPIFTLLSANCFIGEPISSYHIVAALVSLAGVRLVSTTDNIASLSDIHANDQIIGSVCALLAAMFAGVAFTLVRMMGNDVHFLTPLIMFGFSATIFATLLDGAVNPFTLSKDHGVGVICMVLSGTFAFIGQAGFYRGLQICRAGPAALVRNADVPFVYVLGITFMHEIPTFRRVLGSLLIILSTALIFFNK